MLKPEMIQRIVRSVVVGVVVALFFMGLNWLFGRWFGKDASFILAYPPALALHFFLNKKWTFGCARTDSGRQVTEYIVMAAITFLIQATVFKLLTTSTSLPGWIASGVASASQMAVSFLIMQYRIFGRTTVAE
jgi:putative flippase GtrA